jgi:hypothetical protein
MGVVSENVDSQLAVQYTGDLNTTLYWAKLPFDCTNALHNQNQQCLRRRVILGLYRYGELVKM